MAGPAAAHPDTGHSDTHSRGLCRSSAPSVCAGRFWKPRSLGKGSGWELHPDPAGLRYWTQGEPSPLSLKALVSPSGRRMAASDRNWGVWLQRVRQGGDGAAVCPASSKEAPASLQPRVHLPALLWGELAICSDHPPGNVFQMLRPPHEHRRCFCAWDKMEAALSPGDRGAGTAPPGSSAQPHAAHPGSVPPVSTAHGGACLHPSPRGLSAAGASVHRPPPSPPHPFESSISFPDLPRVTDPHGRVLSKMPRWWEGRITRSVLSANTRGRGPRPLHLPWGGGAAARLAECGEGGPRFAQTPREHLSVMVPTPLSRRQDGQVRAYPVALPLKVKDHPAPRTLGPQGLHSGPRLPGPVSRQPHPSAQGLALPAS